MTFPLSGRIRPPVFPWALVLCLALAGAPGVAQGGAREVARDLLKEGNRLFVEGDHEGALKRFRQARTIYPSYKIDFNIATTLRAMGRTLDAAENFWRFLQRAPQEVPASMRKAAETAYADQRQYIVALEVRAPVDGAEVFFDGKLLGTTPVKQRLHVMPGRHKVLVLKGGYDQFTVDRNMRAGELVTVQVPWKAGGPALTPVLGTPAPERPDEAMVARRRTYTVWGGTTLGLGVALAAAAGALYGVGLVQGNAAHDRYRQAASDTAIGQERDQLDSAETLLTVGHVLAGTAVAALGVGITLLVLRPEVVEAAPATVGLGVGPAPGGATLTVGGRF